MKRLIFSNTVLCLLLAAAVVFAVATGFSPVEAPDRCLYDAAMPLRKPVVESSVVLVAIDDRSLETFGPWPWPRSRVARLVARVAEGGARTTGLQILYPSPEENPGLIEIRNARKEIEKRRRALKYETIQRVHRQLGEAEKRIDGDTRLYRAIYSARDAILPLRLIAGVPGGEEPGGSPPWLARHSLPFPLSGPEPLSLLRHARNPARSWQGFDFIGTTVETSFEGLALAAGRHGHVNVLPDPDGVVRRTALLLPSYGRLYPAFSLQFALAQLGRRVNSVTVRNDADGNTGLEIPDRFLPTGPDFRMLYDQNDPPGLYRRISAAAILSEEALPENLFQERAVLIGLTASRVAPVFSTSTGVSRTAPELTALETSNILTGIYLSRPPWTWTVETVFIVYLAVFLILVVPRVSVRLGALIMACFLVTWTGAALFLFLIHNVWLKVFPPAIFVALGLISVWARKRAHLDPDAEERTETNKMLGLSFQSQGLLDMAFDKFMKCPVQDESVRKLLYNLGLDFERKRMFDKAVTVYRHVLKEGRYRDARERIERLNKADANLLLGKGDVSNGETLELGGAETRPTLGRYEVIKVLGRGAMGTVYLGRDPKINRDVAIKTLRYDEIDSDQIAQVKRRFFREAQAAGKLNHRNIVTIYDVGEDHDMAYMAMELLRGKDLTSHCSKSKLLPLHKTLDLVAGVAEALEYAHKFGVVHRDIKPANIMLLADGQVKVTDFGIAQVISASKTQTGVVLGTPNYMSPEQVAGKKVDGRSDMFSLGVVLYELLSGQKPFKGENLAALMYNISNTSYPSLLNVAPEVLPCCVDIVDRLLSKGLTKRFRNAGELAKKLRACREELDER